MDLAGLARLEPRLVGIVSDRREYADAVKSQSYRLQSAYAHFGVKSDHKKYIKPSTSDWRRPQPCHDAGGPGEWQSKQCGANRRHRSLRGSSTDGVPYFLGRSHGAQDLTGFGHKMGPLSSSSVPKENRACPST
jgi:hypothetical protein